MRNNTEWTSVFIRKETRDKLAKMKAENALKTFNQCLEYLLELERKDSEQRIKVPAKNR
jgi:hypothetical protein